MRALTSRRHYSRYIKSVWNFDGTLALLSPTAGSRLWTGYFVDRDRALVCLKNKKGTGSKSNVRDFQNEAKGTRFSHARKGVFSVVAPFDANKTVDNTNQTTKVYTGYEINA